MSYTSKEFIKCRLDNFLMGFFTILRKSQYLQTLINSHEYAGTVLKSSIHCNLKVSRSKTKIYENFASYLLKTKAKNKCDK